MSETASLFDTVLSSFVTDATPRKRGITLTKERIVMDVRADLPFTFCEKCSKLDLDLHHSTYYSADLVVLNDVYLTCRNSNLCKYMVDRIKNGDFQLNDKGAFYEDRRT